MKLTDISIKKLKPQEKQTIFYDDDLPNFGVRVGKKKKTFVVKLGRTRTIKSLGHYPLISLKTARIRAKRLLLTHTTGIHNLGYSEASEAFIEHCKSHTKEKTYKEYQRYLDQFSTPKNLQDITRQELVDHLRNSPSYAHALTAFKIFFNWALRHEFIHRHPLAGERAPSSTPRERVLTTDELKKVYIYAHPPFSTILKLCILTGQRRSEIAAIQPDWIVGDTLTFPSSITKNKRSHTIPLTKTVLPLLQDPLAFNGWSNAKRRIDKVVEIDPWTIHDLRRTFSTIHAQIGTPIHITERLLNHVSGSISGVAAVYNKHTYMDEMRDALEKYEKYLTPIL